MIIKIQHLQVIDLKIYKYMYIQLILYNLDPFIIHMYVEILKLNHDKDLNYNGLTVK